MKTVYTRFLSVVIHLLVLALLVIVSGCGGGGSGSGNSTGDAPVNSPTIEALKTNSVIGGPYIMPLEFNATDSSGPLYIATPSSLVQVDKDDGKVKTLAGYIADIESGKYIVSSPRDMITSNNHLYAGDQHGSLISVYTGEDAYDAIELLYNGHLPGTLNSAGIFGNSNQLIYQGDDGLYSISFDNFEKIEFLTSLPQGENEIIVTEEFVFFATRAGEYSISRYNLGTGDLDLIKSGIKGNDRPPTMAWKSPYLYWVDGTAIDQFNTETSSITRITSSAGNYINHMAADDQYIYACQKYGNPTKLQRVELSTGKVTLIREDSYMIQAMTVENGNLYFLDSLNGMELYEVSENNPPSLLFNHDEMNLGLWGGWGTPYLESADGQVFVNSGEKIMIYDIGTASTETLDPTVQIESFFYHDKSLYAYQRTGSGALIRIPIGRELRPVEEVSPSPPVSGNIQSMVKDDGYFYWIWRHWLDTEFTVYRMPVGGTASAEELFNTNSELRDVSVHNGRAYFSCLDVCGVDGWALVSMPAEGGTVQTELGLADDPRTFYLNGTLYLADTFDFKERSLFALNLDLELYAELIDGLLYDSYAKGITIQASSDKLYVGQYESSSIGPSRKKISRFDILNWDDIGPEQVISESETVIPWTLATDGINLYYWDEGIKRVAEAN